MTKPTTTDPVSDATAAILFEMFRRVAWVKFKAARKLARAGDLEWSRRVAESAREDVEADVTLGRRAARTRQCGTSLAVITGPKA